MKKDNIGKSYFWLFIVIISLMCICDYFLFMNSVNEGFGIF